MGKKTKARNKQTQPQETHVANDQVAEELSVLEAIYDELFGLLDDGMGCKLHVVPSPGNIDSNEAHLDLEIRCAGPQARLECIVSVSSLRFSFACSYARTL